MYGTTEGTCSARLFRLVMGLIQTFGGVYRVDPCQTTRESTKVENLGPLETLFGLAFSVLALTCAYFSRDQICTQDDPSFSPFGHRPKARRVFTHIRRRRRGRCLAKNVFLFYFGISHLFGSINLSVLKFVPAEYATNAFSSKWKYEKLAVVVEHVLETNAEFGHFTLLFRRGRQSMYQEFQRTCTAIVLVFKPIVW